jgi:hypothetical protein
MIHRAAATTTTNIVYRAPTGGVRLYRQRLASYARAGGDSGGIVYKPLGRRRALAVGIHSGGTQRPQVDALQRGRYSHLRWAENDMQIKICLRWRVLAPDSWSQTRAGSIVVSNGVEASEAPTTLICSRDGSCIDVGFDEQGQTLAVWANATLTVDPNPEASAIAAYGQWQEADAYSLTPLRSSQGAGDLWEVRLPSELARLKALVVE